MDSRDRSDYAERFRSSRNRIMTALTHRAQCFTRLVDCIDVCVPMMGRIKQECQDELDVEAFEKLKEAVKERLALSLVVFGRCKTGKSTLLNQLLRNWPPDQTPESVGLFPMADHTCTARITAVTHGFDRVFCMMDPQSPDSPTERRKFSKEQEIRDFIALNGDMRKNNEAIKLIVKIETPSELLQSHLQLVDSPGMGESEQMNEMVRNFLDNCVHSGIIVYVLDGREGYKPNPDAENIRFLMEQPSHLQIQFVVNRTDLEPKAFSIDKGDDEFGSSDDEDENQEAELQRYLAKCDAHSQKQFERVKSQVEKHHPGCISAEGSEQGRASLVATSAKSVKQFIANNWQWPHPPYLDSFLKFESQLAGLVHVNGRHHLREAIRGLKDLLSLAHVHLLANKLCTAIKDAMAQEPMKMIKRALPMIESVYQEIRKYLESLSSHESLTNFEDADNPLSKLRDRFVQDGAKSEIAIDQSPAMRTTESELINELIKTHGKSKDAAAGIRLLCNFKDAVVSHLRAWLRSGYKAAFVKVMFRIAFGSEKSDELDFKNLLGEIRNAVGAFEPDEDAFSDLCGSRLAESARRALPQLVGRPEFSLIICTKSQNWRQLLLDYFLTSAELPNQISAAIGGYCEQLREKKEGIEKRLNSMFEALQQGQGRERKSNLKKLNSELVVMLFYLNGLLFELDLVADYALEPDHPIFQQQGSAGSSQQTERLQLDLKSRVGQQPLVLHYRIFQLETSLLKRFAASTNKISNQFPSHVRVRCLCLADSHAGLVQADSSTRVLLAFDGVLCSLAELQPLQIPEQVRLAWLRGLLKDFAELHSGKYRPLDYRPSNVMISLAPPQATDEAAAAAPAPSSELSGSAALPDPTCLLADAASGQPAASASLAACIATLFGYRDPVAGPAGWDEHYRTRLRDAVTSPVEFVRFLPSCLGALPKRELGVVCDCVRACLEDEQDKVGAQVKAVAELMESDDSGADS